jgi:hypothetical protein
MMWQSRGNENEKETILCFRRNRLAFQTMLRQKGKENWIIERKLLYYLWLLGTNQLKTRPSENHSTKSISFFELYPIFAFTILHSTNSLSNYYVTENGERNAVLSMTDLFLIPVHFPLVHSVVRLPDSIW